MHSGLENAHRVAILEEGLSYKQIGFLLPPSHKSAIISVKFKT